MRAPGLYQAAADVVVAPALAAANAGVAGFVGTADMGPVDVATRVASWDAFAALYGRARAGYLADAVWAFFGNGGEACWVVRVAPGAACATRALADAWGKPALVVRARDDGAWGNAIGVACEHAVGARALLVRDLEIGACEAQVSATRGFEVGALVTIGAAGAADCVVVTEIGERVLRWTSDTPIARPYRAAGPTTLEVQAFDVTVSLRDRREAFRGLQMQATSRRFAPRVIAEASKLVRCEAVGARSRRPAAGGAAKLAGGGDGDAVTADDLIGRDGGLDARTGLAALMAIDEVAVVAVPDAMRLDELAAQRVQDDVIAACEAREDRVAVLDIPAGTDVERVRRWRRRVDSSYAAFYWPWLDATGWDGAVRSVPPSGAIAGSYARRDREAGVHAAPANVELVGVRGVSLRVDDDHAALLGDAGVNTFRVQRGVRAWGARTASADAAWRHVSVRRLFVMMRRSLEAGFAWIAFEPNDARTWERVRERALMFLAELHAAGAFAPGKLDDVCFVRCDGETTSADDVDAGRLRCEIGVAPVTPAELVVMSLVQATKG
jgi:hypothetical protein|nr:phage tail sheath subtilisin-like domain-containing protein [Kofleriaceae bacterium]